MSIQSAPVLTGDAIYVATNDGEVYAGDASLCRFFASAVSALPQAHLKPCLSLPFVHKKKHVMGKIVLRLLSW